MNRLQLIIRVRSLTRDFTGAIFRESDIINYLDEGIDRFKQVIPEMESLIYMTTSASIPSPIPEAYQHLLSLYAVSRCFSQDSRHYQSTISMNEFEQKLEEMKQRIESGELIISDVDGNPIVNDNPIEFVETKSYWGNHHTGRFDTEDIDEGVEGVE